MDELRQIPIVVSGARLEQGTTYVAWPATSSASSPRSPAGRQQTGHELEPRRNSLQVLAMKSAHAIYVLPDQDRPSLRLRGPLFA
jgi:hypothetical protein